MIRFPVTFSCYTDLFVECCLPVGPHLQSVLAVALVGKQPSRPPLALVVRRYPYLVVGKRTSLLRRVVGIEEAGGRACRHHLVSGRVADSGLLARIDDVEFRWIRQLQLDLRLFLRLSDGFVELHVAPPRGLSVGIFPLEMDIDEGVVGTIYVHVEIVIDVVVVDNSDDVVGQESAVEVFVLVDLVQVDVCSPFHDHYARE